MKASSYKKDNKANKIDSNNNSITNTISNTTRMTPIYSEEITKMIIEKVISLTLTRVSNNIQSNQIPSHCAEFSEATLKTFINASVLFFDKESEDDLKGYSITQPAWSIIERESGSQIHLNKEEDLVLHNIIDQNSLDTIEYQKLDNTNSPLSSRPFHHSIGPRSSSNILLNLKLPISNIIKTTKVAAIDIKPSFDLFFPPLGREYEVSDLNRLRLEKAIDLERKVRELQLSDKRKMQISKSVVNIREDSSSNANSNNKMGQHLIELKTITFDSNGKLIPLKYLPLESFKRDFSIPKTDIKRQTILSLPKASFVPEILIPDETIIVTNINPPSTTNRKHYNKKDDPSKRIGFRYDYSGDNYEQIIPSPGVTIISQDDAKIKKGEVNYHRDFHKLSMLDYRLLSEELLPNISSPMIVNTKPKEPTNSIELLTNFNNKNSDSKTNNTSFKGTLFQRKPFALTKDKAHLKHQLSNEIKFKSDGGKISLSNVFNDNSEQTYTSIRDHCLIENRLKHKINFVPKKKEKMISLLGCEQIDRFNKIILQNHNWGGEKLDNNIFLNSSGNNNKKIILERKNPIKRDHVLNDIPDYRTRK